MAEDKSHLKVLSVIGIGYALLLLYASLMPFDFSSAIGFSSKSNSFWGYWPIRPRARFSGSDVLSNLVLYMPLGWVISVRLQLSKVKFGLSLLIAGTLCSFLSLFIEIVQVFTLSRVASASDWLLNTISALAGGSVSIILGKDIWVWGIDWLKKCWKSQPVVIGTLIFLALLTADALSPFMPTILLKQLAQSFRHSYFSFAQGLAVHPWHWWVVKVGLAYTLLTLMLSTWVSHRNRFVRLVCAGFMVGIFCLFLEFCKFFIVSRVFNVANVYIGWAGCFAALFLGVGKGRMTHKEQLNLAICFLILYIFYLAWFPFNFRWDQDLIVRAFRSPVALLPLYDYAMGATLNHARLFVQSIFLLAILVYLFRIRFKVFDHPRSGIFYAALTCAVLGVFQEGGQLFLPARTPSATDVYCFAAGGCLGAWVKRHPNHRLT